MSSSLARWLKSIKTNLLSSRRNQPRVTRPTRLTRLGMESLEAREVPATHTWIGVSGASWNADANWTGGAPTVGETNVVVNFPSNISSLQNIANLDIDQINFNGGSNSIIVVAATRLRAGTQATQIVSVSGDNVINSGDVSLTGTGTPVLQVTAGTLEIASSLTTGTQGFRKTGAGTLTLSAGANTYTGTTTVADGVLLLNTGTGDNGVSNSIVIGDGTGAVGSAVLRLMTADFQIPDAASVTIGADGLLDLPANRQDDFTTLALNGGQVAIATGGTLGIQTNGTVSTNGTAGSQINGAGSFELEGGTITFNIANGPARADLIVFTPLIGAGNLLKTGDGNLSSRAANTYAGTTTTNQGALEAGDAGTFGAVTVTGTGLLAGNGTFGAITGTGGAIAPGLGDQTFILNSTGNAVLNGTAFRPVINGTASDTLRVTGTVNLTNATLNPIVLSAVAPAGTVYTLIGISGTTPIPVGQRFAGLGQGATISAAGGTFALSYTGGDGNEVTLTLVTPANPPAPPLPPPFFSGATVVGNVLTLTGAGVAGGSQTIPLPPGSIAIFADLTGDGRGDVILFLPTLVVVADGQTGRFLALSADINGDGVRDLQIFNLNGTTTTTDGRTGRVMTI